MKVLLPKFCINYDLIPCKNEKDFNDLGFDINHDKSLTYDYAVQWGSYTVNFVRSHRYGVLETGFFNDAAFIDTMGNYNTLSLNTKDGYDAVESFELNGKRSAKEIINSLPKSRRSKFNPEYKESEDVPETWSGVVLALQNPKDRAIYAVSSMQKYFEFVEDCCKYYGNNLFVKMHPWNSNEVYTKLATIARKYGCKYGKTKISVIDSAEFVISYNSTFAVDCLLRGVPYVQYEVGTFFNSYGIVYSKNKFPKSVNYSYDFDKLPDFLIHKFCFYKDMKKDLFAGMIKTYATSSEMFPMTEKYSYANNIT